MGYAVNFNLNPLLKFIRQLPKFSIEVHVIGVHLSFY